MMKVSLMSEKNAHAVNNEVCARCQSPAWARWGAVCLVSVLLSACATGPYAPPSPVVAPAPRGESAPVISESTTPTPQTEPAKPDVSRTIAKGVRTERSLPSPAAQAMIEQARTARQDGQLAQATSLLERAQRMSPQAAEVYYELAAVKMADGAYVQAEQFCQKALSVTGGDASLRSRIWQRIAEIRDARGDKRGAEEARQQGSQRG